MIKFIDQHPISATVILTGLWITLYAALQPLADAFISITGLTSGEHLTEALRFFVFEVPKVLLLLTLVVFVVGIVRTYFSPERTRKLLGGKSLFAGNVLASMLGIVTPFCSCSAIPLFIGFVEAGVPIMRFKPGHREEYHTPFDEISTLDWDIMEKIVKISFANVWELANSDW